MSEAARRDRRRGAIRPATSALALAALGLVAGCQPGGGPGYPDAPPGEVSPMLGALARAHFRRLADRLNGTPRRCLGYRTPREVFEQHLAAPTGPP